MAEKNDRLLKVLDSCMTKLRYLKKDLAKVKLSLEGEINQNGKKEKQ